MKGFGKVTKEVHGRKIISLCRTFEKDLIRWGASKGLVSLSNTSSVSNDSSVLSNVFIIDSNTILDFCRPDSSDWQYFKNTYASKIRDLKKSFSVQFAKQHANETMRAQRSLNPEFDCETNVSDTLVHNRMDRSIVTKLLESSPSKSRRLTIEDAMQTPINTLVSVLIPMWKPSRKPLIYDQWKYISDRNENFGIRLKVQDLRPLDTVIMNRLKYVVFKGELL